jgi:hypothetical protein
MIPITKTPPIDPAIAPVEEELPADDVGAEVREGADVGS